MRRPLTLLAVLALVVFAASAFVLVSAQDDGDVIELNRSAAEGDEAHRAASEDRPLPDVTVYDDDGNEVRLGTLVGQPMVINVWYSTCPPCKRELPAFAAIHRELGDRVRFVGVNPVDPDGADAFARELGVQFDLLRDPDGALLAVAEIDGFPTTLLVDEDGMIVDHYTGAMTVEELRAAITQELLA